jgi:very-short-patch-repair endonuclease
LFPLPLVGRGWGWGSAGGAMMEKRSDKHDRIWAPRDRSIQPQSRIRARDMRRSPTEAERKLWWNLRHRISLPNSHFRRQVRVGHYIVDFACHQPKIVIEVDGGQHAEQTRRDAQRSRFLESKGYRILRFWNVDVLTNIESVLELIQSAVLATPTPTPPHKGEGKAP